MFYDTPGRQEHDSIMGWFGSRSRNETHMAHVRMDRYLCLCHKPIVSYGGYLSCWQTSDLCTCCSSCQSVAFCSVGQNDGTARSCARNDCFLCCLYYRRADLGGKKNLAWRLLFRRQ